MNWLTHYIQHENRHGRWLIEQEDGSGRFTIRFHLMTESRKLVFLGSTRTAKFAIVMLRAGETRHPYEINPADCDLPKNVKDWDYLEFTKRHPNFPFDSWGFLDVSD